MKAQEFLIEKLRGLSSKYEEVKIRYEYRANTQSHIIEIIPLSFFDKNAEYLLDEANIERHFEELYPSQNIVFISEGSLIEIRNADLELGYDKLVFDYNKVVPVFEVIEYSDMLESAYSYNYALAA
ncbi:MAG TPA: hypothetical protein PLJ52_06265 [Tenuifilaceae bacterium]|nr:hypothetical protein [Tenuifilaceae bacterium]